MVHRNRLRDVELRELGSNRAEADTEYDTSSCSFGELGTPPSHRVLIDRHVCTLRHTRLRSPGWLAQRPSPGGHSDIGRATRRFDIEWEIDPE